MSDCNNSSLEDRPGSSSTSLVTQEENDEASLPSPTLSLSQRSASANSMESQEPRQEPQIVESDCVVASQESGQVVAAEGAGRYSDQHGSQSGSSVPLSSLRGIVRAVTQTKEISVEQLGEALSHSHIGEEYNRFIQYTIRECRIDVENARSLQLAVADVPQSSDSVVRAQLAVIARLSDAVVGMAALIDSLMTQTNSLHDLPEDIADTLIGCCLDGLKLYAPELDGEIDHLIENPTR
ncbi:hypothetical protein GCK32_014619 [Trichostrongylus colubriformis]|uniref:Uncharacterized protein n=1 Tax=Trichostrongylus colubriformis TaxID=6319 RepID=A0AAN8F0Y2_TRICO